MDQEMYRRREWNWDMGRSRLDGALVLLRAFTEGSQA